MTVRIPATVLAAAKEWAQAEGIESRSAVIACLVELGLGAPKSARRPGGPDPVVPVRLPKTVIADIDRWAKREKIERSKAVRAPIEKGLADALDE